MIKKFFLLFFLCGLSCSSDEIIRSQKSSFYDIYKNIIIKETPSKPIKESKKKLVHDRGWLSKFNQPIISLHSEDDGEAATLVALGNYKEKLTWVSADGISISFANGILIATKGYSQDLMESQRNDLNSFFTHATKKRKKTYRYLNGQNEYWELNFSCSISAETNKSSSFLDLTLNTTKFTETCKDGITYHSNEYYVLPNTNIVLKSKQWISEANGYIKIYNYYAFQNNIV